MRFNRKTFFNEYRKTFGALKQEQVAGIEFLLDSFEADTTWKDVRHIAYALATVKHETANTYKPIKEYRSRVGSKGRANQDRYWLSGYYGRGFVQITWKRNYEKFGIAQTPEKALEPETAFWILTAGMHRGLFTGKKLSDFIKGSTTDYRNARKIINGLDKADLLAGYARSFEKMLSSARETSAAASSTPSEQPETTNDPPEPATPAAEPTESGAAENATTEDGSLSPQIVTKERPSVFTRVMTGILGGLGTAFGSVAAWFGSNEVATRIAEKGGERIVENAGRSDLATLGVVLLYIVGIGGVGVFFFWLATKVWEKSSERAKELNVAKISAAASKEKNTVEFSG